MPSLHWQLAKPPPKLGFGWVITSHSKPCLCNCLSKSSSQLISVNSSSPGQNGRHFTDNIFKCIFVNEKTCILIRISLKFVPQGLIDNKSTLVQVMAWCRTGDKPLPKPMLPSSLTHICGNRGDRVNKRGPRNQEYAALNILESNFRTKKRQSLSYLC